MKRRLGILTVAVVLICLSVSLGTWVAKRQGEMQTVGWSPLFESREQRALTPLRVMAQPAPPETQQPGCTRDCTETSNCGDTSDCADTEDDCTQETLAGPDCDTVDLTCGCDSWSAPCEPGTFDIANCSTYEATCYENDPNCAEPTTDAATCSSNYPTCDTCAGLVTCDATCDGGPNCEGATFAAAATCDSATPTCSTCEGSETCDAFPCEDTWDDTCECGTVVTTCAGVATCDDTCVTGAAGCTYDATCSGETCDTCDGDPDCKDTVDVTCYADDPECKDTVDYTCDRALPTCHDTCDRALPTCDDTCGFTCDRDGPFCGDTLLFCGTFDGHTCDFCFDTCGFTCDVDDPTCPGDTVDVTCAWDDPDCADVTLDCPDTWECERTMDCPGRPEVGMDFGDAPDPSRHTRLSDEGARHLVDEEVHLGLRIDEEPDGQPNPASTGDDIPDRRDDEDGVWFTTSLLPGRHVSLIVEASAEGYLDAWVDADNDGEWSGAGEQIFVGQPLREGFNVLSFDAPRTAIEGPAYSRFRFSSEGYLSYSGLAADGEVEDHYLPITEVFGAAIKTDRMKYRRGEDATVTFYLNEAAEVRLVETRMDEKPQVLWSGTLNSGTHRFRQVPITRRVGRGAVALVATSLSGSTTMVSTPFDVLRP